MWTQKYSIQQPRIESLMTWVMDGDFALREIPRHFVLDKSKVPDLMDSNYKGLPICYINTWKDLHIQLKNWKLAEGEKIMINGRFHGGIGEAAPGTVDPVGGCWGWPRLAYWHA